MIETLFLNMFFGGKMKAMPPKAGQRRPAERGDPAAGLLFREGHRRFARGMEYPIIPCNLCGSQENAQRKQIKAMLRDWDNSRFPGRIVSIATALKNVVPSHLADGELFDFRNVPFHRGGRGRHRLRCARTACRRGPAPTSRSGSGEAMITMAGSVPLPTPTLRRRAAACQAPDGFCNDE